MKNKNDPAQTWLTFASEDLQVAELIHRNEDIPNQVCFHAQQCVENILKVLLIGNKQPCPKIHDLEELYKKCIKANILELLPFKKEIELLSLFYLPTRYPDALVGSLPDRLPTGKDAEMALEAANKIYNQLRKGLTK